LQLYTLRMLLIAIYCVQFVAAVTPYIQLMHALRIV
jgi:hypothetical protein